MWEGVGGHPVSPDHRLGGDERVDDRFLGRLDGRVEHRVDDEVADRPHVIGEELGVILVLGGQAIAGREGDEQVAAGVPARPTGAGQAETRTLGQALQLVGE